MPETKLASNKLFAMYDLEERGLIKEFSSNMNITLEKADDGFYYLLDDKKMLRMIIEPLNEFIPVSTAVPVIFLTNPGLQLASLLARDDEAGLRAAAKSMTAHDGVRLIELYHVEKVTLTLIETLLDRLNEPRTQTSILTGKI